MSIKRILAAGATALSLVAAQFDNQPGFMNAIQIQPPPVASIPDNTCQVTLMKYVFSTWDKPFVGKYEGPPANCPGPWSHVILKWTTVAQGTQFDRLGTVWMDGNMMWELSTAEPTRKGIYWEFSKEVGIYSSLWKNPGQLVVNIPNVVNEVYTAPLNATMTAIFVPGDPVDTPADIILPVSKGVGSFWSLPDDGAAKNSVKVPTQSIEHASLHLFASGNANEEFWYGNTLNEYTETFNQSNEIELLGGGPFREVQVLIDGKIAGFAWPFPIVYTGGIVPGLWRPLVGINAYDVPAYEVSLDPWLHVLADGKAHEFELRVLAQPDILNNWFAAANIMIWSGPEGGVTTGEMTQYSVEPTAQLSVVSSLDQANTTLITKVTASREISISSNIQTPSNGSYDKGTPRTWHQIAKYSNQQIVNNGGHTQYIAQSTRGQDSTESGVVFSYDYPVDTNSTFFQTDKETVIEGTIDRTYTWEAKSSIFSPIEVAGRLTTRQVGAASYYRPANGTSSSTGNTTQHMEFEGSGSTGENGVKTYTRYVEVELGVYLRDEEVLNGQPVPHGTAKQKERSLIDPKNFVETVLGAMDGLVGDAATDVAEMPIGRMLGRRPKNDLRVSGGPMS